MAGSSPRYGICRYCQERFAQTIGPGRKREYCSVGCRSKAQRDRSGKTGQHKAPTALPLGRRIAEDLQALSAALLEAEYDGRPLQELLRCASGVTREVDYYTAAAVQDARSQGSSWEQVAEAAQLSVTTARTRWPENRVRERLRRRAAERAEVQEPLAPIMEGLNAAADGQLSKVAERASAKLASALSHLHRSSGLTIRDVGERTSLSPSYVSRILSGERTPAWAVVGALTELFGGDPAELSVLFESAHGKVPPAQYAITDAVDRLHAALRGLHLAAGRPRVGVVRSASHGALSVQEIDDILEGVLVPGWEQTSALVTALGGWPADVRPLWQAVHYTFLLCMDPPKDPQSQSADPSESA